MLTAQVGSVGINPDGGITVQPIAPPVVVEDFGAVDLLLGETSYFVGNESRALTYQGALMAEVAGWTYIGVETGQSFAFELILRNEVTGEYVLWGINNSGQIIHGEYLTLTQVRNREAQFQQDLDGDGEMGNPPAQIVESFGVTSLLLGTDGYYVDNENRPLTYLGTRMAEVAGWTYLGAEAGQAYPFNVILRNDITGEYALWGVDDSGAIIYGEFLIPAQLRGRETQFQQDLNGDGTIGNPPAQVVESFGSTNLLLGAEGYYVGDEGRPIIYQGNQMMEVAGWTYLGAEADQTYAYAVILRNDVTGEYALWGIDDSGNIVYGEFLSSVQLRGRESQFQQDLDGDQTIGFPPAQTIESFGQTTLLLGETGYFIGDTSRPVTYQGSQINESNGWSYLGVEAGQDYAFNFILRNETTGQYVRWGINSSGAIIHGEYLTSIVQVRSYEAQFQQDFDTDGYIGTNPNDHALEVVPVGTMLVNGYGEEHTFIRHNGQMITFNEDYETVEFGSYGYARQGVNQGLLYRGASSWFSPTSVGTEQAEYVTVNYTSSYTFKLSDSNATFEIYPSEDTAPNAIGNAFIWFPSMEGYNTSSGHFSDSVEINLGYSSNEIPHYWGNELYSYTSYSYQKVGPREAVISTQGISIFGQVSSQVLLFFVEDYWGYGLIVESFPGVGATEYEWGYFYLY